MKQKQQNVWFTYILSGIAIGVAIIAFSLLKTCKKDTPALPPATKEVVDSLPFYKERHKKTIDSINQVVKVLQDQHNRGKADLSNLRQASASSFNEARYWAKKWQESQSNASPDSHNDYAGSYYDSLLSVINDLQSISNEKDSIANATIWALEEIVALNHIQIADKDTLINRQDRAMAAILNDLAAAQSANAKLKKSNKRASLLNKALGLAIVFQALLK